MANAFVPVCTAAPATTPVTLGQAKAQLRIEVDETAEDDLIEDMIAGVTEFLDGWNGWLGLCLITQTWRHSFADWSAGELRLALPAATAVAVKYTDLAGVEQTLASGAYHLVEDMLGSVIVPAEGANWPALGKVPAPVRVEAQHGFANAAAIPAGIRQGILQMVADWYENRSTVGAGGASRIPLEASADRNLSRHRRLRFL